MTEKLAETLRRYARQYETAEFLEGDPSWFMHQVCGKENQESMAFVASCLSFGSRPQFMPKIQSILTSSGGDVDMWIRTGEFEKSFQSLDNKCFYRLYSCGMMCRFLHALKEMLADYGSLGDFVKQKASTGLETVDALCRYFSKYEIGTVIPKDSSSACKRLCMFLRWMVRTDSPVDLGLWANFIDRRSLIIPLDTHVLQQSIQLGLLKTKTASMRSARQLTQTLAEVFPDDPLKGDFALFGLGINSSGSRTKPHRNLLGTN